MPAKKRRSYPVPSSSKKQAPPPESPYVRTSAAAIDVTAVHGRTGLSVGDRVKLLGTGLYSGETAIIKRFAGSAIPAAVVETESGGVRQVRTIDLEALPPA